MNQAEALKLLEKKGTRRVADGMARYGIVTEQRVFGVSMGTMQSLAKQIGKDHALAAALWNSGWYEAQMLATLIEDPRLLTRRQMNAWVADFDNWAIVDTACFCLFDKSPLAWDKAPQWARSPREFVKRTGFALMACLALHDKSAPDKPFLAFLPLIEQGARDERNFVKKGVSWALRSIGRRSLALNTAGAAVAVRLAASKEPAARWVGRVALKELTSPKVRGPLARRAK